MSTFREAIGAVLVSLTGLSDEMMYKLIYTVEQWSQLQKVMNFERMLKFNRIS